MVLRAFKEEMKLAKKEVEEKILLELCAARVASTWFQKRGK